MTTYRVVRRRTLVQYQDVEAEDVEQALTEADLRGWDLAPVRRQNDELFVQEAL